MRLPTQRLAWHALPAVVLLAAMGLSFTGCAPQNIGPYNETAFGAPGPRISVDIWRTHDDWFKEVPYWNVNVEAEEYEPIPGPMPSDLRPPVGDYIVGPGDLLEVTILDLREPGVPFNVAVRVSEIGNVSIPTLETMRAAGFTLQGVEERIADRLRDLIREPRVSVFLAESRNRFYSMLGGVARPNIYPLIRNDMSLMEAIAAAGGTLPFIDDSVIVIREFTPEELNAMLLEIYASRGQMSPTSSVPGQAPLSPDDRAGEIVPEEAGEAANLPPEDVAAGAAEAVEEDRGPTDLELMQQMAEGRRVEAPVAAEQPAEIPSQVPQDGAVAAAGGAGDAAEDIDGGASPASPAAPASPAGGEDEGRWVFRNNMWVYEGEAGTANGVGRPGDGEMVAEYSPEVGLEGLPADIRAELARRGVIEGGGKLQRVFRVNLPMLRRGDVTQNVVLQHNDKIDILEPPAGEFYMDGEVVRRGVYSLTGRDITVLQAVTAAGGLTQLAIPKRGMLTRRVANNKEEIIYFDLAKIANGESPDFFLQPDDLIRVGTDQGAIVLAVLRNAFRATYGFGLVYDQNFADIYPWKGDIAPLF